MVNFSSYISLQINPHRVSNYKKHFNQLNIEGFDFKWILDGVMLKNLKN